MLSRKYSRFSHHHEYHVTMFYSSSHWVKWNYYICWSQGLIAKCIRTVDWSLLLCRLHKITYRTAWAGWRCSKTLFFFLSALIPLWLFLSVSVTSSQSFSSEIETGISEPVYDQYDPVNKTPSTDIVSLSGPPSRRFRLSSTLYKQRSGPRRGKANRPLRFSGGSAWIMSALIPYHSGNWTARYSDNIRFYMSWITCVNWI